MTISRPLTKKDGLFLGDLDVDEKWLGKITKAEFGSGGYDDVMFGFSVTISGTYGVSDFWGWWSSRPPSAQWSDEDWDKKMADVCRRVKKVLSDAKAAHISDLIGKPVEVSSKDNRLESWRILTEVV